MTTLFDRINAEIDPDELARLRATNQEFGGATYDARDKARLSTQLRKVLELMQDGRRRSLAEIKQFVGGSEAGVSARLRDLRKRQYGGHDVRHQRRYDGVWFYWVQR